MHEDHRFGAIAIALGFATSGEVEHALKQQAACKELLGRILFPNDCDRQQAVAEEQIKRQNRHNGNRARTSQNSMQSTSLVSGLKQFQAESQAECTLEVALQISEQVQRHGQETWWKRRWQLSVRIITRIFQLRKWGIYIEFASGVLPIFILACVCFFKHHPERIGGSADVVNSVVWAFACAALLWVFSDINTRSFERNLQYCSAIFLLFATALTSLIFMVMFICDQIESAQSVPTSPGDLPLVTVTWIMFGIVTCCSLRMLALAASTEGA